MIDAVRYLVDNGIKWRAMPSDFPPWPRVYAFFARWRDTGLVAELHDRLRGAVRGAEGRDQEPSAAIVDSQSVKADATVALTSRGFDAGKKINGRKRHLLTDTLGLLLAVEVIGLLVDVVAVATFNDAYRGGPRVHPLSDRECRPPAALVQQLSHLGLREPRAGGSHAKPSGRPRYAPPEAATRRMIKETMSPWLV
ncbi:transposase [Streptomyces pseudogriseolus]